MKENTKDYAKKRPTIKDVANLANVSVATVSYVMNGKAGMRISEATRKKVLQAINILNYSPNAYAVGLSVNQSPNIILRSSTASSVLHEMHTASMLLQLSDIARQRGYSITFDPNKQAIRLNCAACICVNMDKTEFYSLSNENFMPIIILDSCINDPVFYQVTDNYHNIDLLAKQHLGDDYVYVCLTPHDDSIQQEIQHCFANSVFVDNVKQLVDVVNGNKAIALSQLTLYKIAQAVAPTQQIYYYDNVQPKCYALMDSIASAIDRINTDNQQHFQKL